MPCHVSLPTNPHNFNSFAFSLRLPTTIVKKRWQRSCDWLNRRYFVGMRKFSVVATSLTLCVLTAIGCGGAKPATTMPAPPALPSAEAPTTTTDSAAASTPPAGFVKVSNAATKVRSVEGITEYKFANGMQLLLFPDNSQARVTVNINYLVGSRMEGYGETGMAHLLEHMMFKGTKKHRNVLKLIDERGGQANGTTWNDRTNYYETLPATDANLEWALDLEADRMHNATILPEDLATEFSVVRNEFEMGENDPVAILTERMVSTAFLWHNYGNSTIGSRADIERVPVPALRAFYEKYYQPDTTTLVIAGKFDEAKTLKMVEDKFGSKPKPTRVIQPTYTVEPVQDGERDVVLRRNGDVAAIGALWHTPGAASPDFVAVSAAMDILTRQPSGRLYKKLVDTKLATSLSADLYDFKDPYLAGVIAAVRDQKNLDRVLKEITTSIESFATTAISNEELERWRNEALKNYDLMMADSRRVAIQLTESIGLGDWRTMFSSREQVKNLKIEDVARVARLYFKSSNRTTGRFLPTKEIDRAPLTDTPNVANIVKGIEGGGATEVGEAFAATYDNIESRTVRKELKGGIRAALLPKKTRGGKVELTLTLRFGDEASLQKKSTIASMALALLARGTTRKSFTEIKDLENKLKSNVFVGGGTDFIRVTIRTLREQLAPALQLAAELATSPSFPAAELEVVRQQQLTALEEQRQDPETLAFLMLQRGQQRWSPDDPRYVMTIDEQIAAVKKVSLAEIKAFYRDFVGGGRGELTVVGDFDADKVTIQVEQLFGGWVSKKPYQRLASKVFDVKPGEQTVNTKDKENASLAMGVTMAMKTDNPDYPAWLLVSQILGGGPGSRLWMRLREKEGLSYGTGSSASASDEDNVGSFDSYAIVAPQNLKRAKASMLDEIRRIQTATDIVEPELTLAKDGWIKQEDTNLASDAFLRRMLAQNVYLGRTTAWQKSMRDKIAAVTLADLKRVAAKYVDVNKLVIVSAGDMAKINAAK
jgi:zinc protease